jgi:ketosteroid isomerase-like protein
VKALRRGRFSSALKTTLVIAMASKPAIELNETERRNIEHACAALCVDYCEIVDSKDYQRLRNVFADDATFVSPAAPDKVIAGADAIISGLSKIPSALATLHFALNVSVRAESPDSASGSCRIMLYTADGNEPETGEGRKAAEKQRMGIYYDRYVRRPEGWRIADRRGKALFHT